MLLYPVIHNNIEVYKHFINAHVSDFECCALCSAYCQILTYLHICKHTLSRIRSIEIVRCKIAGECVFSLLFLKHNSNKKSLLQSLRTNFTARFYILDYISFISISFLMFILQLSQRLIAFSNKSRSYDNLNPSLGFGKLFTLSIFQQVWR